MKAVYAETVTFRSRDDAIVPPVQKYRVLSHA